MKKYFYFCLILLLFSQQIYSQIIYNHKVDSIINLVSLPTVIKNAKELSGDTITNIGGLPYLIYSRYYLSPSKFKAAQYIYEKFQSYGLNTVYQINDTDCLNVIAKKTGSKYPNKYFVIGAHFDDVVSNILPTPYDTIPGADDNASGVCAVLEAARLLSNFNSDYSLIFVVFDKEEFTLGGSISFVDSAYARGDSIKGALSIDMIAYDGNNDNKCYIFLDTNSSILANQLINTVQVYQTGLQILNCPNLFGGDHYPFWLKNYRAIGFIEDILNDFNPKYHTKFDKVNIFSLPYFLKTIKSSIALFSSWATGYFVNIEHKPLISCYDTTSRIANVFIEYPFPIGIGTVAPRLYYKLWNGTYNYVNPFFVYQNNYKFLIPGFPRGSKISYYIAAQDSAGTYVFTLPTGGGGINPPGTTPPTQQFSYYVWTNKVVSSNTVPKPITGFLTQDTIHIQTLGSVVDVNVNLNLNHTNDGNLHISLAKVSNTSTLSQYNGLGGQNFSNTIFDDSAAISITQGNPPFTGRFRPQTPLSVFSGSELSGDWILRIVDIGTGNTGTLLNWSLEFIYAPTVTVKEISTSIPDKYLLYQNYPNPFNPVTKIRFEVPAALSFPHAPGGNPYIRLMVFDITGREIQTLVNEQLQPGTYEVTFDGINLSSGIYFYQLKAGEFIETKRMVLIK